MKQQGPGKNIVAPGECEHFAHPQSHCSFGHQFSYHSCENLISVFDINFIICKSVVSKQL